MGIRAWCGGSAVAVLLAVVTGPPPPLVAAPAQSCPAAVGGTALNAQPGPDGRAINTRVCSTGGDCEVRCKYGNNPSLPDLTVVVQWRLPDGPAGVFPGACTTTAPGNYVVNQSHQVVASWFPGNHREGASVAHALFAAASGIARVCPGARPASPPDPLPPPPPPPPAIQPPAPPAPPSACDQLAAEVQRRQALIAEIDHELFTIEQYGTRLEGQLRDRLAHTSLMIAALNTPGYNGGLRDEVARVRTDRDFRASLMREARLPLDAEPVDGYRALRDQLVSRIEFIRQTPARRIVLQDERVLAQLEIAKLQLDMTAGRCGGRIGADSCDVRGRWVFNVASAEAGRAGVEEAWTLTARADGRYDAALGEGPAVGTAEVFGHDLVLRWQAALGGGTYTVRLRSSCDGGTGTQRFIGVPSTRMLTAERPAVAPAYVEGSFHVVEFDGREFATTYRREVANGVPIDVFFFSIVDRLGQPATVNGERLWGRFVRTPSTRHSDQSSVVWWFVDHRWNGSAWVMEERRGIQPVVR